MSQLSILLTWFLCNNTSLKEESPLNKTYLWLIVLFYTGLSTGWDSQSQDQQSLAIFYNMHGRSLCFLVTHRKLIWLTMMKKIANNWKHNVTDLILSFLQVSQPRLTNIKIYHNEFFNTIQSFSQPWNCNFHSRFFHVSRVTKISVNIYITDIMSAI